MLTDSEIVEVLGRMPDPGTHGGCNFCHGRLFHRDDCIWQVAHDRTYRKVHLLSFLTKRARIRRRRIRRSQEAA